MNSIAIIWQRLGRLNQGSASLLLLLLLCADLAFVLLHIINAQTTLLDNPLLSVERDNSYPELYQYLKWFWIIILLLSMTVRKRATYYLAWGAVFAFFLLDDVLIIHENAGRQIADLLTFTPPWGVRRQDVGELAVSTAVGLVFLPLMLWAYWRGSTAFRKMSQDLLLLMVALVFFGVVVDIAHMAIQLGEQVHFALGLVDDGGEMVVASLMLWYLFLSSVRDETAAAYLGDFFRSRRAEASM